MPPPRSLPRGRWRQRWSQNPSQEPTSSPKPRRAPRPPAPRRPARYRARAVGAKTRRITQGRLRVLPPMLPPPPEVPRAAGKNTCKNSGPCPLPSNLPAAPPVGRSSRTPAGPGARGLGPGPQTSPSTLRAGESREWLATKELAGNLGSDGNGPSSFISAGILSFRFRLKTINLKEIGAARAA